MHPYISEMVAAERTREMHQRAAAAQRTRAALGGGPGRTWFWRTEALGGKVAQAARLRPADGCGGPVMSRIRHTALARAAARAVRAGQGLARRVAAVLAECHYAQRRMSVLASSPDRYAPEPGRAPDTYAEFLFRTSGTLRHEPAANRRSAGHAVR